LFFTAPERKTWGSLIRKHNDHISQIQKIYKEKEIKIINILANLVTNYIAATFPCNVGNMKGVLYNGIAC
jgi:hypothetical protein